MNNLGFYIKHLKVTGIDKKDAEIVFEDGFNLVTGVSDTGKSYIFSCLNYMLGKEDNPKSIPESAGYNNFYLGIKTYEGKDYTIYRKLIEKSVKIKNCKVEDFPTSKEKSEEYSLNMNKKQNLSSFLLKINGIEDKVLKKSKSQKVDLIFTYIRKLSLISETRIVVEESPFYPTSQYTERTLYQSILIYLLTGKDYSDFIPEEKEEIRKSRLNGKLDFVKNRIESISLEIEELNKTNGNLSKLSFVDDINGLQEQSEELNLVISDLYKKKLLKFKELEAKKSSHLFFKELIERMELLEKHYNSDLERLSFIDEGQDLLSQLQTVNCPLCDAEMESDKLQEIEKNISVKESIDSEKLKIVEKLKDLNSTIQTNQLELEKIKTEIESLELEYYEIDNSIKKEFIPKLNSIKEKITKINEVVSLKAKTEQLDKDLSFYINERKNVEIQIKLKPTPQTQETVNDKVIQNLSTTVKAVLKAWKYPNCDSVIFDPGAKVFDFVISGKARSAYGKGMRAVSYSAILYALIKYCLDRSIPFTRSLIIDSPLTTYHGKETKTEEHEIDENIEHAYFKFFAMEKMEFQFIMFDNKIPSPELMDKFHYLNFTGNESDGRFGFFPIV